MAATVTSTQPCTVMGSGQSTSADLAAFANGVMIRYLDFNDGYTSKELDLIGKVNVNVSEEANRRAPEAMVCKVEVVTYSGQRYASEVGYHKGHYKNPLTDAELAEKFHSLADKVLPPSQADTLLDRLWHLEEVAHIGEILSLTKIEPQ